MPEIDIPFKEDVQQSCGDQAVPRDGRITETRSYDFVDEKNQWSANIPKTFCYKDGLSAEEVMGRLGHMDILELVHLMIATGTYPVVTSAHVEAVLKARKEP